VNQQLLFYLAQNDMKLEQSNKVVIKHFSSKNISLMVVKFNVLQQKNYPIKLPQKLIQKCTITSRIRGQKFSLDLRLVCEMLEIE
jgi:hypothetical protein